MSFLTQTSQEGIDHRPAQLLLQDTQHLKIIQGDLSEIDSFFHWGTHGWDEALIRLHIQNEPKVARRALKQIIPAFNASGHQHGHVGAEWGGQAVISGQVPSLPQKIWPG